MGYFPSYCGYTRLSASGIIGDSGKPILVAGFSVLSGATAAVPYFRNGTGAAGDTIAFRPGPVTASVGNTVSLPMPVMLNNGCYVSFDANTTEMTVFYIQMATS